MIMEKEKIKTEDTFAKKLKLLRNQKNLSQTEFGKLIGYHYTHVCRFERGDSLPSIDGIKRIAKKLKVSVDYLIFENGDSVANTNIQDSELIQAFSLIDNMKIEDKNYIKNVVSALILQHQAKNSIFNNNDNEKKIYKKRFANSKIQNTL